MSSTDFDRELDKIAKMFVPKMQLAFKQAVKEAVDKHIIGHNNSDPQQLPEAQVENDVKDKQRQALFGKGDKA